MNDSILRRPSNTKVFTKKKNPTVRASYTLLVQGIFIKEKIINVAQNFNTLIILERLKIFQKCKKRKHSFPFVRKFAHF